MSTPTICASLEEVRARIDAIDQKIIALIGERSEFVSQAARFKRTAGDVKAPSRVEEIIVKVRALSLESGVNPDVAEATYRAMISAFIDLELAEHAALNEQKLGVMDQGSVDQIVSRAEELRRERGRVLIALDGRGGAGKSTLARAIVQRIPRSAHVEHDWFHLPKDQVSEGRRFDHERLIAEVLSPFRSGARELRFLRYNWGYLAGMSDGFHETPISISDVDVVVVEGVETLHRSLDSHFDLRVWVDTSPELSLERGMRRDVEEYHLDPERVRAAWKEWSERESESLARDDRRDRADVIIKG